MCDSMVCFASTRILRARVAFEDQARQPTSLAMNQHAAVHTCRCLFEVAVEYRQPVM